ncbi:MAG TPA: SPOR domain-containing protein [Pseudolabrys sp.]|nr:SPOR domain-containing protein [Pseudolabrys sp.]
MADDQIQRTYRPSAAPARGTAGVSATGSDPLAELARLIGQTDPFAEFGRENARRPAPASAAPPPPSFGSSDYFDAPSAPQLRPAPLQPPPAYAPPPSAARQANTIAPGAFPPPGGPPGFGTDAYHLGQAEHAPDDAGYYEEPPQPKRRIGVIAVAAVLALAVLGTAGAFGYRAVFGGSRSAVPPPVIKADTAPIKVVPAGASKTPSKLITDRIGDQAEGEKLVSREEKPVEVRTADIKTNPALAPPPGTAVLSTEPKKVHTIVIHPDQMGNGQQAPVAAAPPPAPARTAPPPAAAAAPPPRAVEARTAAPAQGAAPARGNAPLSLNPDAPATRATRTAAVAPAAPAPAPAPPAAHAAGGYAVQVSSQRSEADAQAAFRGLQAKYPNILGNRQPLIHKVELGAKGTYYRAMVGPFANANEATELCNGLKAAGGSCLIQRN